MQLSPDDRLIAAAVALVAAVLLGAVGQFNLTAPSRAHARLLDGPPVREVSAPEAQRPCAPSPEPCCAAPAPCIVATTGVGRADFAVASVPEGAPAGSDGSGDRSGLEPAGAPPDAAASTPDVQPDADQPPSPGGSPVAAPVLEAAAPDAALTVADGSAAPRAGAAASEVPTAATEPIDVPPNPRTRAAEQFVYRSLFLQQIVGAILSLFAACFGLLAVRGVLGLVPAPTATRGAEHAPERQHGPEERA